MTTSIKTCFKCGAEKSRTEFYRHPKMVDGLLGKCKECTKNDVTKNRNAKLDYYRKKDRDRGSRQTSVDTRLYRANNPEKYAAHTALNNALRYGKIEKAPCMICGVVGNSVHGHHDNYSRPLDVVWLCAPHHFERHKSL